MMRLLTAAALTGAALVGGAAPASANHQCQDVDGVCYVTGGSTIPVGTPVLPATHTGPAVVDGPRLCDTSTGQCTETYVLLPRGTVSADGRTLVTVTVPAYGVSISRSSVVTLYYSVPPVPAVGSAGVTVEAVVPYAPLLVEPDDRKCPPVVPWTTVGPLHLDSGLDCTVTVRVTL